MKEGSRSESASTTAGFRIRIEVMCMRHTAGKYFLIKFNPISNHRARARRYLELENGPVDHVVIIVQGLARVRSGPHPVLLFPFPVRPSLEKKSEKYTLYLGKTPVANIIILSVTLFKHHIHGTGSVKKTMYSMLSFQLLWGRGFPHRI